MGKGTGKVLGTMPQKINLEGASGIIWSNLSWQKQRLDKMMQQLVQLNLKTVQHWGICHFPRQHIPVTDCSHCEKLFCCV